MKVAQYYLNAADARREQLEFEHEVATATNAEVIARDLVCSYSIGGYAMFWRTVFKLGARRVEVSLGARGTDECRVVVSEKGNEIAKYRKIKDAAQALMHVVQSLRKTNSDEVTP